VAQWQRNRLLTDGLKVRILPGQRRPLNTPAYGKKELSMYDATDLCVIFLTCGRKEYFEKTEKSWRNFIKNIQKKYIVDDSGNTEYREWLINNYSQEYSIVFVDEKNSGYVNAMNCVLKTSFYSEKKYCIFIEEDWVLINNPNIDLCKKYMEKHKLGLINFQRIPWRREEKLFGGSKILYEDYIIFEEKELIVHDRIFSSNPGIFLTELYTLEVWEEKIKKTSESFYIKKIKKHGYNAGLLLDNFYVEHIGHVRAYK
jgi:hypothetical protein